MVDISLTCPSPFVVPGATFPSASTFSPILLLLLSTSSFCLLFLLPRLLLLLLGFSGKKGGSHRPASHRFTLQGWTGFVPGKCSGGSETLSGTDQLVLRDTLRPYTSPLTFGCKMFCPRSSLCYLLCVFIHARWLYLSLPGEAVRSSEEQSAFSVRPHVPVLGGSISGSPLNWLRVTPYPGSTFSLFRGL